MKGSKCKFLIIQKAITITKNAICRNENEEIPKKKINGRWDKNAR